MYNEIGSSVFLVLGSALHYIIKYLTISRWILSEAECNGVSPSLSIILESTLPPSTKY